ncbi:hypothetical protein DMN91_010547 [Ooceraea biroi]|uniref:Reverse transcriptase domain-containing protein n=1 Tax=Ooceraea biroi TaxID=2015173 RepID=A0A3L8D9C4_OOCBI|nr:hypothetical protein DMN91_010547 [Ooceraea biroi]
MDSIDCSHLNLCHVNCQSLFAHLDEFRAFFGRTQYHVVCVSKSWLRPEMSNDVVALPGYRLFRRDRVGKRGGGVAFYLASMLHAKIVRCSSEEYCGKPEFIVVEILAANASKLLLAVVYRPHCGDFNADLGVKSYDSGQILEFVGCHNLYLVPYKETHVTGGVELERRSCRMVFSRDFRSFDEVGFLHNLEALNWGSLYETDDIDNKIEILNRHLISTFDVHAPERLIVMKNLPAPWMSGEIRRRMQERNAARRRWRRSRCDALYKRLRLLRNEVQCLIREAKYYLESFKEIKDSKEFWSKFRHLGLIRAKKSDCPLEFSVDDLNEYFVTANGPCKERSESIYLSDPVYSDSKFYLRHITPADAMTVLLRSKSQAMGVDRLPSKLIHIALPCILPVLTHIFNFSLLNGVFPNIWKETIVVPLPKTRTPDSLQHFRPISILCCISKALERLVARQAVDFLEQQGSFDPFQSAYRRGHSTQTALIRVMDDIRSAADDRRLTVSVFFNFSKAFDCVSHETLIDKLRTLDFSSSALRWFCSYLD